MSAASRDATARLVLVVDDDPEIRQALRWTLEDEGLLVDTAADGQQALERGAARPPSLVILDMGLPRLDGAAVARSLRGASAAPPPILLITADGNAPAKARQTGAVADLHKPLELEALLHLVWQGLGRIGSSR